MKEEEKAPGIGPEVQGIFERALPAVRAALRDTYLMGENESRVAEEDLRLWFHRLARRAGAATPPPSDLRESLVVAACQYGRSYQTWRVGAGLQTEPDLTALLARDPKDVAREIEKELEQRGPGSP